MNSEQSSWSTPSYISLYPVVRGERERWGRKGEERERWGRKGEERERWGRKGEERER